MKPTDVPVPRRMRHLARDGRGYPIPYIVLVERGDAYFTINDTKRVNEVARRDLCGICGQPNTRGRWFVGGPLSAFHDHGAYLDPPMHAECAAYSLRVCPYLCAPRYSGRIDHKQAQKIQNLIFQVDKDSPDDRPELFIAGMAVEQTYDGRVFIPKRPFRRVVYWRGGIKLEPREATPLVAAALAAFDEKSKSKSKPPPSMEAP